MIWYEAYQTSFTDTASSWAKYVNSPSPSSPPAGWQARPRLKTGSSTGEGKLIWSPLITLFKIDNPVKNLEIVMPDLIRHPEHIEITGSGYRRNDGKELFRLFTSASKLNPVSSSCRESLHLRT